VRLARLIALTAFAPVAVLAAQSPRVVEQTSGTKALLKAVSAVNDNVVWASGGTGIVRTLDGGDTWELKPVGDSTARRLDFRDIHAASANEAWVLSIGNGPASRIYHTTDGGSNWKLQFQNADSAAFFDCFTFFDAKHAVVFGDETRGRTMILRTEDGGEHWDLLPESAVPAPLKNEGGFASSGGCITSYGKKKGWVAAGAPEARIFRSEDQGRSWKVIPSATPFVHDSQAGLTALSFRDEKHGIGVAARINAQSSRDTSSAVVGTTDDGGLTWTIHKRPAKAGSIYGVTWVPKAGNATAVAASLGGLLYTTAGGDGWTAATEFPYWSVGAAGKRAWGVGPGGRITRVEF
jgi:photosystem II stability/assembly factor-like uncharacterized protein